MKDVMEKAILTSDGVAFSVCVDFVRRDCMIPFDTLNGLTSLKPGNADPLEIFHAFEARIRGVARRLVAANVRGTPLQLNPQNFR